MSPRRTTYRPAERYRGNGLVRGLLVAFAVEVLCYAVMAVGLAQYLAESGPR
jgi:hypothetical protein